jgi:quinol monooxygenase YgiN
MNRSKVFFNVGFSIHPGKLETFERIAEEMRAGTEKETGTHNYEWFFSKDRTRCRLFEAYADANAVLAHLEGPAVQELVPKLLEVSSVSNFEIYGDPGSKSAEIVTPLGAEIFNFWRGLTR